jgi:hypothetical protein
LRNARAARSKYDAVIGITAYDLCVGHSHFVPDDEPVGSVIKSLLQGYF